MVTGFIDGWLHPLGESDSDIGAVWHLASKKCGDATGRRQASDERRDWCRYRIKKYLGVSDGLLGLARSNEEIYAWLVNRWTEQHIDSLNEVLGDTWNVD